MTDDIRTWIETSSSSWSRFLQINFNRPGKRRSLMRRALAGVVPNELLNRKTEGFHCQAATGRHHVPLVCYRELTENSILVALRITDRDRLIAALEQARAGNIIPLPLLAHAVVLEKWLRHIRPYGFVSSLPGAVPSKRPAMSRRQRSFDLS